MQLPIVFGPVSWSELSRFLKVENSKISRDVDRDVRTVSYAQYTQEVVEGLYLDDILVGFAQWNKTNHHLSKLYVAPHARGRGIARDFIQARAIRTLYVMPHNHLAKQLYARLGFHVTSCASASREFMIRPAPMPAA